MLSGALLLLRALWGRIPARQAAPGVPVYPLSIYDPNCPACRWERALADARAARDVADRLAEAAQRTSAVYYDVLRDFIESGKAFEPGDHPNRDLMRVREAGDAVSLD